MTSGDFVRSLNRLLQIMEQRGVKAARPPIAAQRGVRRYEEDLRGIYEGWSDNLAADLAEADEDEHDRIIKAALAVLLLSLRRAGRDGLPEAAELSAGTDELSGEMQAVLDEAMAENDRYLEESLIPALRDRLSEALSDADILAALEAGEGEAALAGNLDAMDARVGLYAGAWWVLYHNVFGIGARERGSRITAYLDPLAQHCNECPLYQSVGGETYESMDDYLAQTGGRVPGEFECVGNCRCWLAEA